MENLNEQNAYDRASAQEQDKEKQDRKVTLDSSVTNTDEASPRNEENIERNSTSKVTSDFEPKHGRTNEPLGDSHEPGTLPGSGF